MELKEQLDGVRRDLEAIELETGKVIVGQRDVVRSLITAVLANGHVLLEGLPGLGKTMIVKTLRDVLGLSYSRIQFTPDLMPADITGTNLIDTNSTEKNFRFEPGPIFANLLLADEINRASPKTQSALLQAMQEREVTVFGKHFPLQDPFYVIATQNPIEMEGTYPLPEAQLDRFLFKLIVRTPALDEMMEIAGRTTGPETGRASAVLDRARLLALRDLIARVPVAEPIMRFAARLVLATHPARAESVADARRYVRYGASPRGLQALVGAAKVEAVRDGRYHVSREDIMSHLLSALRHRIILNFEGEMEKVAVDDLLTALGRETAAVRD